jgi:hypothetical protein
MGMGKRLGGGGRLGMLKRFALGMGGKSGVPLVWLLYDEFTTADAAPITSPRTCEPGPGTLTSRDTTSVQSISGGVLESTGANVNYDPGVNDGSLAARSVGDAVYASVLDKSQVTDYPFGYYDDNVLGGMNGADKIGLIRFNNTLYAYVTSSNIALGTFASADYKGIVVHRSVGGFYIIDGKLRWVDDTAYAATETAGFGCIGDVAQSLEEFGELSLPANGYSAWDADFSTVTDTKTNPATGTLFDCNADFHTTETFTWEANKTIYTHFRYTDVNNSLYTYAFSGTLLRLYKIDDGTPSQLGGSITLTDGVSYQLDIVGHGSSIKVYLDNVLIFDVTETFNQTVAQGRVYNTLDTNDIVLSTHPYPALGIATDCAIAPQDDETFTQADDCLFYIRNITVPAGADQIYRFRYDVAKTVLALHVESDGGVEFKEDGVNRINVAGGAASIGDDMAVIIDGRNIEIFVNGTSIGSSTGVISADRTTGTIGVFYLIGSGESPDSVEIFPRDVSDLLPKELV